ncbi:MAG: IS21-like element helper ATPase IstB [Erysipelotrichaceae bacterium]|nr:IS21-like element helper ATPase IstB [Erysipelotrichaceae bacterium]MBR0474254.1 IS21-like element helper ATPase IstB [Erysipelotrichaceae bacterium]
MKQDTYEKMIKLRLPAMAQAYKEQESNTNLQELNFDQRLSLLIDTEFDSQANNHIKRLIENARFSDKRASIEDIKYYDDRKLDKQLFLSLSTNSYIDKKENIVIIGATGSGKIYLACALGNCACKDNRRTRYIRLPDLLVDFSLARDTLRYQSLLKSYARYDLLIIDEWLLTLPNEQAQQDILELMERRCGDKSTILCSQFTPESWHKRLGGGAVADAILDRVLSISTVIQVSGDKSMRTRS